MVALGRGGVSYGRGTPVLEVAGVRRPVVRISIQGYLAHMKTPTPLGPPQDSMNGQK